MIIALRTLFAVLGIWLLLNALFVAIMMQPGDPQQRETGALAPMRIDHNGHKFDEQEEFLLRHVIVLIAGMFFSFANALIEAPRRIERFIDEHFG
jgi:hypothetical protein